MKVIKLIIQRTRVIGIHYLAACILSTAVYADTVHDDGKVIDDKLTLEKGNESLEILLTRGTLETTVSDKKGIVTYHVEFLPKSREYSRENLQKCTVTPHHNKLEIEGECGEVDVNATVTIPQNLTLNAKVLRGSLKFLSGSIQEANLDVEQGSLFFRSESAKARLKVEQGYLAFDPPHVNKNHCIKIFVGQGTLRSRDISIPGHDIRAWIEEYPKISLYSAPQCSLRNSDIELIVKQGSLSIK